RREDVLAVGRVLRRGNPRAGDRRDVGSDVVCVLSGDEVLRHRRDGQLALVADDLLDRPLLGGLLPGRAEGVVQISGLVAVRAGVGGGVAAAALRQEELLARAGVAALRDPPRAAARREQGGRESQDRCGASHYSESRAATASSRVPWIVKTRSRPVISKI